MIWVSALLSVLLVTASVVLGDHHDGHDDHEGLFVETTSGKVEGIIVKSHNDKSVEAYMGVPYAEAPVGELRFKPPVPKVHSESTLITKAFGHSCPQMDFSGHKKHLLQVEEGINESEDCLVLNIWAPHPKPEKAAVLVFFHDAGGLVIGTSSREKYDGRQLAEEENIIVVTLNFRLAELGFLFLDHPDAPGNVGLMDQALALQWVQNNIAHFGGDPNKVTLSGYLDGSFCVGMHLLLPSSKNLFHQVFMLDGNPLTMYQTLEKKQALEISHTLAELVGCQSETEDPSKIISCLREKPLETLMDANFKIAINKKMGFRVVVDGHYLTAHPSVLLNKGATDNEIKAILVTSHNKGFVANSWVINQKAEEGHIVSDEEFDTLINELFRKPNEFLTEVIKLHYTSAKHPDCPEARTKNAIELSNDVYMICPMNEFADELTTNGHEVHRFDFNHHSSIIDRPVWAGNCIKGECLEYLFGHVHPSKNYTEEEHAFSHRIMHNLSGFVKTGLVNSPRYNLRDRPYAKLQIGGTVGHFLRAEQCDFWQRGFPKLKLASEIMTKRGCH